jgi:hypothetical protein
MSRSLFEKGSAIKEIKKYLVTNKELMNYRHGELTEFIQGVRKAMLQANVAKVPKRFATYKKGLSLLRRALFLRNNNKIMMRNTDEKYRLQQSIYYKLRAMGYDVSLERDRIITNKSRIINNIKLENKNNVLEILMNVKANSRLVDDITFMSQAIESHISNTTMKMFSSKKKNHVRSIKTKLRINGLANQQKPALAS